MRRLLITISVTVTAISPTPGTCGGDRQIWPLQQELTEPSDSKRPGPLTQKAVCPACSAPSSFLTATAPVSSQQRVPGPAHAPECPSGPVWREWGDVALMIHDAAAVAQGLRAGYEAINLELRFSGMLQPVRKGCRGLGGVGVGVRKTLLRRTGNAQEENGCTSS